METKKATSAEIVLGFAFVSPELTKCAETWIAAKFGAFFRMDGIGHYDGESECAFRYIIGTSIPTNVLWQIVADFAVNYCKAGAQESVYFVDKKGAPYLVFANGSTQKV